MAPRKGLRGKLSLFGEWVEALRVVIGVSYDELEVRVEMDQSTLSRHLRNSNLGVEVTRHLVSTLIILAREKRVNIDARWLEEAMFNAAGHATEQQRERSQIQLRVLQDRAKVIAHIDDLNEHITKLEEMIKHLHQEGAEKDARIVYLEEQREVLRTLKANDRRRRSPQDPTSESTTS